jgi:hypothetical protein
MSRLLAFALLALLLLQSTGPLVVFSLQRLQIRREVRERLLDRADDAALDLVPVPVALERAGDGRFRWMEEKEFRLDGRMYDVVRAERRGDTTWYRCVEDRKETALLADLDALIRRDLNNTERRQQAARALRLTASLFLPAEPAPPAAVPRRDAAFPAEAPRLLTLRTPPPTPPPES